MEQVQITAEEILDKLSVWVKNQTGDNLSVQNLKHATAVLKDIRDILKVEDRQIPEQIRIQIGNEEYAG